MSSPENLSSEQLIILKDEKKQREIIMAVFSHTVFCCFYCFYLFKRADVKQAPRGLIQIQQLKAGLMKLHRTAVCKHGHMTILLTLPNQLKMSKTGWITKGNY